MTSTAFARAVAGKAPFPRGPRVSAVARHAARMAALTPDEPDRYGMTDRSGERPGDGWLPIRDAVTQMLEGPAPHLRVSSAVAGARIAGSLGYAAAGRAAVQLALTGVTYDSGPESLLVRLDEDNLVDAVGVRAGRVVTLRVAVERAYSTLAPALDRVHERTRFGVVPMWNLVADTVLGPCTRAGLLPGQDQAAARARGEAFVDGLLALGAPIRRRGTTRAVELDGRPVLEVRRGSCCLFYRQDAGNTCDGCPVNCRREPPAPQASLQD